MSDQNNLGKQRELYGEPLGVITGRIADALGLTQARLASVLGLSAPMLSQLNSGHRVKIGNPAVVARLQALSELADGASSLSAEQRERRLASIQETTVTLTDSSPTQRHARAILRRAADAAELRRLADLTTAPRLAELLREASETDG